MKKGLAKTGLFLMLLSAPEVATDGGLKRVAAPSTSEQTQPSAAPVDGAI